MPNFQLFKCHVPLARSVFSAVLVSAFASVFAKQTSLDTAIGQVDMSQQLCVTTPCPVNHQKVVQAKNAAYSSMASSPSPASASTQDAAPAISDSQPEDSGKLAYRGKRQAFNQLDCHGNLVILLDPSGTKAKSTVQAASGLVSYKEHGRILKVSGQHGRAPVDVIISGKDAVKRIESVNLYDGCSLHGQDLHQPLWQLNSQTTGEVKLRGMFERCTVVQGANNQIDMYWVGANAVDVVTRAGQMRLAGAVEHARIRSSGSSQLMVRQLRAQNAWLYATGGAYVELFGSRRFIVFADGAAQILVNGVPVLMSELTTQRSMLVVDG